MTKEPDVKLADRSELRVKTESFPDRCEICHQADHFNPETNSCLRCDAYNLPNKVVSKSYNYSTVRAIFTATTETILGGFTGLIAGGTIGYFLLVFFVEIIEHLLDTQIRIGDFSIFLLVGLAGFLLGITVLDGDKRLILKSLKDLTLWAAIGIVIGFLTTTIFGYSKAISRPIDMIIFCIMVGTGLRRIYTLTERYRKSLATEE